MLHMYQKWHDVNNYVFQFWFFVIIIVECKKGNIAVNTEMEQQDYSVGIMVLGVIIL